jgi:hypothetical protein
MTEWNGKVTVDSKEYKIEWEHERYDFEDPHLDIKANTFCYLHKSFDCSQGSAWVSFGKGWASCSWSDNFSRKVGRKLSLQRALLNSDFTQAQRKQVWDQVLSIKGLVK